MLEWKFSAPFRSQISTTEFTKTPIFNNSNSIGRFSKTNFVVSSNPNRRVKFVISLLRYSENLFGVLSRIESPCMNCARKKELDQSPRS